MKVVKPPFGAVSFCGCPIQYPTVAIRYTAHTARVKPRSQNCYPAKSRTKCEAPKKMNEVKSADAKFISGGAKNRVDSALKSLQEQLRVMSINPSGRHYVIIDEVDCLSQDKFQPALRAFMTENAHAMFILTTNHLDRVDYGIKSRCKVLHIVPPSPYCGENSEPGRHTRESLTTNPRVREQPRPEGDIRSERWT